MKVLYGSDIHLEFDMDPGNKNLVKPNFGDIVFEECDVLLLAGDITACYSSLSFPHSFFQQACEKAGHVLYIPGNHEFYSNGEFTYQDCLQIIGNECSKYSNLIFGTNIIKTISQQRFVGATLWTDFEKGKYTKMAEHRMNDYRQCKGLTAEFTARLHGHDLRHIVGYTDEHSVVFSHHAPSKMSTHPRYAHQVDINSCYSTDVISKLDRQPSYWVHGHTHSDFEYLDGETRVLAHPRGYFGYETYEQYHFARFYV
jgi:hypothetical protein